MIKNTPKKIILYSLVIVSTIVLAVFSFGALYKKAKQIAIQHISEKIQSEIAKADKTGQFKWDKISVSVLPLKAKIENVIINISDNNILSEPVTIKTLIVEPDYRALLTGILSAKITLKESNLKLNLQQRVGKKNLRKKPFSLSALEQIPISRLILAQTNLTFNGRAGEVSAKELNAYISLKTSKINVNVSTDFMKVKSLPVFSLYTNITIKPKKIHINQFSIKNKNSWLNVSAMATGDIESQKIQQGRTQIAGSFFSKELTAFAHILDPDFENPLKGKITLKSDLNYDKASLLSGHLNLSIEQCFIRDIFLSQVQIKGTIKNQILFLSQFQIRRTGKWYINLKQSKIHLKKPYQFQAKADIKNSQLNELFKVFKLKDIPVASTINGKWQCNGSLLEMNDLKCKGDAYFNKFTVYGGRGWTVLEIPQLKITSQIDFNDNTFKAHSTAELGTHSKLIIESQLDKKNQFSSIYSGAVYFSDIKNLVSLDPKGSVNIQKGSLTADKHKLQIQSQLDFKQLSLSQFRIGNGTTLLHYTEKGVLRFRKIIGQIKNSQYKGNLSINIFENTIKLFTHFPSVKLQNLKHALENRVYLPFEITGAGTLNVYLNGPLKINAMNYNLQAQFFKVKWEKEHFNSVDIQLESKNGYVKTKKAEFLKKNGKILFQGQVDPKGDMLAKITGEDLHLHESFNILQVTGLETTGIINFNMTLRGYFLNPLTTATIHIKNSFYKGYPVGDSRLNLRLRKHQLEAKGTLSNKLEIQNLVFPFKKDGIVELKATTNNLNIKEIFFSKGESTQLYSQFQSQITGAINLSYQKNQFLRSATGFIKINQLSVHANSYNLTNQFPFSIDLKKGHIQIDPISLKSGTDVLNIIQQESERISVSGNTKLDFFIFLFPFMRTWEGNINTHISLTARLYQLSPKGYLKIKNGFVQIHPHIESFEELYSDITVENKKLIFQSLHTKIGGGVLQATGDLNLFNLAKTQVNIKGFFKQVQFGSLPGIHANGSGQISLTGGGFPYTLGITATIENSIIEKEFMSKRPDQVQISPRLIPLEENKESFSPIKMKFNLHLKEPLRIENSTMKSSFIGKMKITGSPIRPALSGVLKSLPGGKIIFRDHEFDILSSRIAYSNDKPSNPLINLRAETLLQENNETTNFSDEYNILLRVKGRGKAPVFKLTSAPAMTENEIVSLLTFGARSIQFEPGNPLNNIAKYSYYHLGPVLFQKAIGQELTDTLGLVDQFLIVPHISSKTNTTATKLILRRKMFNQLNLSSSHTILDETRESDVKAKYKINKNISLIGIWQNETTEQDNKDKNPNTIGLDLEYQLDF